MRKIIFIMFIMFCMLIKKYIYHVKVSKRYSKHEKPVIILMISNGKGWYIWKWK